MEAGWPEVWTDGGVAGESTSSFIRISSIRHRKIPREIPTSCTPCWFVAYDASRLVCSRSSAVSPTTQEHTSASCCAAKSIVRPCRRGRRGSEVVVAAAAAAVAVVVVVAVAARHTCASTEKQSQSA